MILKKIKRAELERNILKKAINIVEGHVSDSEFSVETLESAVGLSRGHLYKN